MIVHDCAQGSAEWWDLRIGIPTPSRFARILTASKLAYSKGARPFVAELLAEQMLNRPLDYTEGDTLWTSRGSELEDEARKWYAFHRDVTVTEVGFCTTDDGTVGCSPDGLVGADGGLEIKCRSAKKHMVTILGIEPIADPLQVQGNLWVTGRDWWDIVAYNPELPKKITRQFPMPRFQEAIEKHLGAFLEEMDDARQALEAMGDVIEDGDELLSQLIASIWAKTTDG